MKKSVTTFELDGGRTLYVETDDDYDDGFEKIGVDVDEEQSQAFKSALSHIEPAANELLSTLQGLISKPDGIEVEFGIKLSGKVGALIASTSTEANFKIKLSWKGE